MNNIHVGTNTHQRTPSHNYNRKMRCPYLFGCSGGGWIHTGQRNGHISLEFPHHDSEFRFHQENTHKVNKTQFSQRGKRPYNCWKIKYLNCFLLQREPWALIISIHIQRYRIVYKNVYIGSSFTSHFLCSVCSPFKMLLLCS